MTQFRSHLWVTVAVLLLAFSVWIGNEASRSKPVPAQEVEKVLEIERYPDEPLQLVDLRIGPQSVKQHIKKKFRDPKSQLGWDRVSFKEKEDWFKRVSVTFRNTSTRPIYGLNALLHFKPPGYRIVFELTLTGSKQLRNDPLQPGAEIELTASPGHVNQTLETIKSYGADVKGTDVTLVLDTVIFSDELRWNQGNLVRPDPTMPHKWIPVVDPVAMKRNKSSSPLFAPASFKPAAPAKPATPFVFATCTAWSGTFLGTTCSGQLPFCITRNELDDNVEPGLRSHMQVPGPCVNESDPNDPCVGTSTTHTKLVIDSGCPTCPDADGDGAASSACGGTDCRDDNPAINRNAPENCNDGIDNNCDGLTDDEDHCSCPEEEEDIWVGGGIGYDCTLCQDGVDNDCDGDIDAQDSGCHPDACASPVLIDVLGNGFDLTNALKGVNFDINGDGKKEKLSWTAPQSDDAWLALDRNGDGLINSGSELFGNFTPQSNPPLGTGRNGFNALVEYDKAAQGGNTDGLITDRDSVFRNLLLWQDTNHNGISEANELRTLTQLGLVAIECDYKESKKTDQNGNKFRYRAKVRDLRDTKVNRWAWDVFLVPETSSPIVKNLLGLLKPATNDSFSDWLQN